MNLNNVAIFAAHPIGDFVSNAIFRPVTFLNIRGSIGWTGACAMIVAAYLTRRLERSLTKKSEPYDEHCSKYARYPHLLSEV
jgi:hypothetical protein